MNLPCPSGIIPLDPSSIPPQDFCPLSVSFNDGKDLTATIDDQLNDPPQGGTVNDQKPGPYNPYPFFYPLNEEVLPAEHSPGNPDFCPPNGPVCLVMPENKFTFYDVPLGLWDDTPASISPPDCCFKEFTTTLVGVSSRPANEESAPCAPGDPRYCTPLYHWRWNSTFNGTAGGVTPSDDIGTIHNPPDPGSGTGGVTITDLNGVPQTPPSVTCAASPSTLWPPNGKPVEVTVSGTVTPGTQAIPAGGTTVAVTDEYNQVQPSGSFTTDVEGNYSFTVELIASRNGNDQDGRTYTINSIARDVIGNAGTCTRVVTVPHDQGGQ